MKKHSLMYSQRKLLALGICLTALLSILPRAQAQGDGPRAYFPLPVDSNIVAGYGMFIDGNKSLDPGFVFSDGNLELNVGVFQYTRCFNFMDQTAGLFGIVPAGKVSGTLGGGSLSPESSSSGLGDIILGGVFTLYGMPAMTPKEFQEFDPGFSLSLLAKLTAPTGAYDDSQVINLGTNRWSAQVGVPLFYYFGETLLDEDLTTIEILPTVTFFTDNNDPFGGSSMEQDPLFRIEAHITRNINRALWVSLDSMWTYGGETTTDGVSGDNTQSSLSLGGSVGLNLSQSLSIKASYGGIVARNDNGAEGHMFRTVVSFVF